MKQTICVLAALALFSCGSQQKAKTVTVEGSIKNAAATTVYLEENVPNGGPSIMDSATLGADGRFELKAPAKEETLYQLRLQGKLTPFAFFINDAAKLTLNADLNNPTQPYTVEGSPASQAMVAFDKTLYEKATQLYRLNVRIDSLGKAKADSLVSIEYPAMEAAASGLKSYALEFLQKSNSPVLTLYGLGSFQNTASNLGMQGLSAEEIRTLLQTAAKRFPDHTALQAVSKSFPAEEQPKAAPLPRKAPEFTQPGIDGKPVSLSSFKGKYVLIDFWASWCKPCRMENPNVVKAFETFKDKNFTVFGVSLDQQKEAWQKAIQQDGLAWTHASDLKYWSNEAAALYGVQGIPANFLVDPQGNIVAQDLRGQDLENTLRRLLR